MQLTLAIDPLGCSFRYNHPFLFPYLTMFKMQLMELCAIYLLKTRRGPVTLQCYTRMFPVWFKKIDLCRLAFAVETTSRMC